jgi:Spy/CpxP family protein refolding chaperone
MKKTIWITIIVVALTATISVSAFASNEPERLVILKDLQLTEAQKEKLAQIRQTIKDDPKYQQFKNKMMELGKLKVKKPVDPKPIANQWKANPKIKDRNGAKEVMVLRNDLISN